MKNFVAISIPSVTFSSREVERRTIYDGVDDFIRQLCERLRVRLQSAGVDCDPSSQSFKPEGRAFHAGAPDRRLRVIVCPERDALPKAALTIITESRVGFWGRVFRPERIVRGRSWSWFEPIFRGALEAEFPGCDLKWMTLDEFIQNEPSG